MKVGVVCCSFDLLVVCRCFYLQKVQRKASGLASTATCAFFDSTREIGGRQSARY